MAKREGRPGVTPDGHMRAEQERTLNAKSYHTPGPPSTATFPGNPKEPKTPQTAPTGRTEAEALPWYSGGPETLP